MPHYTDQSDLPKPVPRQDVRWHRRAEWALTTLAIKCVSQSTLSSYPLVPILSPLPTPSIKTLLFSILPLRNGHFVYDTTVQKVGDGLSHSGLRHLPKATLSLSSPLCLLWMCH